MTNFLFIIALGFFLGMRHATDADHVIAVTTIVTRQRHIGQAAITGLLWGVGHTLTILAVGAGIILFNLVISERVGASMELSVGVMLIFLGVLNVRSYFRLRPAVWRQASAAPASDVIHTHVHAHGDYIHSHPHGHAPEHHPHAADRTPLSSIDRTLGRVRAYAYARPLIVGIVHGLAGSAAVTLLVLATIRDSTWAIAYLVVFGIGTIAGMMLITMSIASAFRFAGGTSETFSHRLGLASGVLSIAFGLWLAYEMSAAAGLLPPVFTIIPR
jgi:high-affinity nickel permease